MQKNDVSHLLSSGADNQNVIITTTEIEDNNLVIGTFGTFQTCLTSLGMVMRLDPCLRGARVSPVECCCCCSSGKKTCKKNIDFVEEGTFCQIEGKFTKFSI